MAENKSFWVVATTKPQRERWAAENVARQGAEFYLPRIEERDAKSPLPKEKLMFPRYLFVQTEGQWRFLLGTYGITGLVMSGDHPATVPARELDRLRARENERGVVVLDPEPVFPFSDGDLVRVTEGPFTGLSGIYQCDEAHTRVRVLLEYLGRKTRVAVDDAALQAVV